MSSLVVRGRISRMDLRVASLQADQNDPEDFMEFKYGERGLFH